MRFVQSRFAAIRVSLGFVAILVAGIAAARTWTSSDGKHQIDAELVKSADGKVVLKKPSGETVTVDASRLSEDDQAFLKSNAKPAATSLAHSFADLSSIAEQCATADEVVTLYNDFLADTSHSEDDLTSARNNLPIWQGRAAKKMVHYGNRWVEPAEAKLLEEKSDAAVHEAVGLLENNQGKQARDKLREAAREDPQGLKANFLAGLIDVFALRDLNSAKLEFQECVRRNPRHVPSLNNLALVSVRLGRYDDALTRWKTALDEGKVPKELMQNVDRLAMLSNKRVCAIGKFTQQKLETTMAALSEKGKNNFDVHVGWLYMPYDPGASQDRWIVPDKDMPSGSDKLKLALGEDPFCMNCGGLGQVKCPNCRGAGQVKDGMQDQVISVPGSSQKIHKMIPKFAKCRNCDGSGHVRCPICVDGIDGDVAERIGKHVDDRPRPARKKHR